MSMNLLREGLIAVRTDKGEYKANLGQILAALATLGKPLDFPQLRPHQQVSWHTFLCQAAAIAMIHQQNDTFLTNSEGWNNALENIAGTQPWELVEDDWTKPAFLQPPLKNPAESREYGKTWKTPDEMDITVGSKRIDLKDGQNRAAEAGEWIHALICSQTAGGYEGAGRYGIARMNSGAGNRHIFTLSPRSSTNTPTWQEGVTRDATLLTKLHREMPTKEALLWTIPWDGIDQLDADRVLNQPLCIEICRRTRLKRTEYGQLEAKSAGSKVFRIKAKALRGAVADPWTLTTVDEKGAKAATVSGAALEYRQLSKFLNPEAFTLPEMARMHPTDQEAMTLVVIATPRGQGGTEGHHQTFIPFGVRGTRSIRSRAGQKQLADICKRLVDDAGEVAKALGKAIQALGRNGNVTNRGKETKKERETRKRYQDIFHATVEDGFWTQVSEEMEQEDQEGDTAAESHTQWILDITGTAEKILRQAEGAGLCRSSDRYPAVNAARARFRDGTMGSNRLRHYYRQRRTGEESNDQPE